MTFISQLNNEDKATIKNNLLREMPFGFYPASELNIDQPLSNGRQVNYLLVRSVTQGLYRVTDFDCAVINGSSENAKAIKKVVKDFLVKRFPDDYSYFYNKNLSKKLEEERIK